MHQNLLIISLLLLGFSATAQSVKVYGKVTNAKMEPLAFASVQVKEYKQGSITKEDGSYKLELYEDKYLQQPPFFSFMPHLPQPLCLLLCHKLQLTNSSMQ